MFSGCPASPAQQQKVIYHDSLFSEMEVVFGVDISLQTPDDAGFCLGHLGVPATAVVRAWA